MIYKELNFKEKSREKQNNFPITQCCTVQRLNIKLIFAEGGGDIENVEMKKSPLLPRTCVLVWYYCFGKMNKGKIFYFPRTCARAATIRVLRSGVEECLTRAPSSPNRFSLPQPPTLALFRLENFSLQGKFLWSENL